MPGKMLIRLILVQRNSKVVWRNAIGSKVIEVAMIFVCSRLFASNLIKTAKYSSIVIICYHLLSWCSLFKDMIQEATLYKLDLQLSRFSIQRMLARLNTFQIWYSKECFGRCKVSNEINGFKTTLLYSLPNWTSKNYFINVVLSCKFYTSIVLIREVTILPSIF